MAVVANRRGADTLGGRELRNAIADATRFLEKYRDIINALNVFPVPDGDTGTNLLLTMESVNQEAESAHGNSAESVSAAMAKGALLGARGNSGVILSQFLQGLANGLKGLERFNGKELAHALELGNQAAYRAVSKPVEGTMLTVIRELARAARQRADAGKGSVVEVWESALKAAKEAVSHTPQQLPVLREAGVVDAGGQGIAVILEGALKFLRHEKHGELEMAEPILDEAPISTEGRPSEKFLTATESEMYGYEAVFIIEGAKLDLDAIREQLNTMGESVVVTGSDKLVKIHIHTADPGPVLTLGISLGTLRQITVENLDTQHRDFISRNLEAPELKDVGVLAVTWGEGFTKVYKSLGVAGILPTGETMNPSAREVLDCVRSMALKEVIVLPNNPNVIPVAQQAAALAGKPVYVVPSRTLPQGIAAVLAFNPDEPVKSNLMAMKKALGTIATIAVTRAIRPSSVNDIKIRKGNYIGLVDDNLVHSGGSLKKVLFETLEHTDIRKGSLVTLYWGTEVDEEQAEKVAKEIRKEYSNVEVEVMWGAQPLYHFIASLE
jgi:DAK2 domain fusion protein YloV